MFIIDEDEIPKYTDAGDERTIDPPPQDSPEFKKLQKFCDEVEIILHVVKDGLRAAARYMDPPNQYYNKAINFPVPSMVIGMFAGKKTALVQTLPGNKCRLQIEEAIINFKNAKYIILVGVCYAFSRDKYKLGDVLVSNAICNIQNIKFQPDSSVEDRGETIDIGPFLHNIFCRDVHHDPPFNVTDSRESKVYSGRFISSPILMNNEQMRNKFQKIRNDVIAGEMEGGIVLEYVRRRNNVNEIIIIKAVADYGDGRKDKKWEFTAAMAAVHYAHSKLKNLHKGE